MALPTILVNSATGNDTTASGAGPSTALSGTTNASTDGTGLIVTLPASTDTTNVAVDGSHVIYLADATAGGRNFGKITAKAGSGGATPTVTVSNAFGLSQTNKSWAIGGKRATLLGTNSSKLIENNGASGDAMPGWIMEMESGHTEIRSSSINPRRAGDATDGPIIVRGTSGAGTMPKLTFSNNGDAFIPRAALWTFRDFEINNSTSGSSSFVFNSLGSYLLIKNLRCSDASNKFNTFLKSSNSLHIRIEDCTIANTVGIGVEIAASASNWIFYNNRITSCGSHGINISANVDVSGMSLIGNIIAYCTSDGFSSSGMSNNSITNFRWTFRGNVFHANGGDGIDIPQSTSSGAVFESLTVENNEFTFNGAYGLAMGGGSISDIYLRSKNSVIRNNTFYSNTSGKYSGITVTSSLDEITTDPSGGLASATKDYAGTTTGTNFMSSVHKALGYPIGDTLLIGGVTGSSSYNYQDIGLQHKDAGVGGSGAGPLVGPGRLIRA